MFTDAEKEMKSRVPSNSAAPVKERLPEGVWRCTKCSMKMYDALDDEACTNCHTNKPGLGGDEDQNMQAQA